MDFKAFSILSCVLCLLLFVPATKQDDARILRILSNMNKIIGDMKAEHENQQSHLTNLFIEKTDELKGLVTQQETVISALQSQVGTMTPEKEKPDEIEEGVEKECPLQQALLSLLQDNPSNVTEELTSRLNNGVKCDSVEAPREYDAALNSCQAVPMEPERTVGLFKIRIRTGGVCKNVEPVDGLNKCQGACDSVTEYKETGGRVRLGSKVNCCKPAEFEKIPVSLICESGHGFTKSFDNIIDCRCQLHRGAKSN